ncbi:MAG TPA: ubiquitin-like protein Pup [Acidimicrobiaceae bacterium]|jgi:ubiquitin-like protein Pup|nr:ubiquitin-like protein Pup [Actinomycetota bacterium]MDG1198177.1 ubiquitin-like protein Pup [Actinomycetota bacterium]NCG41696.1 ubiquitin-like protein Pup [Actinomycetota bacterium]HAN07520.1 ubiquitin-like protein Pup [Acidimicrobiaceae bacterium]
MAEREQRRRKNNDSEEVDEVISAPVEAGHEIKSELDDLLDEIDGVLETNAEEFVKNYVQKGGE